MYVKCLVHNCDIVIIILPIIKDTFYSSMNVFQIADNILMVVGNGHYLPKRV